ncbi:MAG TPA: hypothetical protein VEC37_18160 [Bacillota bacterium]|nr:hypothetical protein [Bacillota bacterium]
MAKLPLFTTVGKSLKNALFELYHAMGYTLITSVIWFLGLMPIGFLLLSLVSVLPQILKNSKQLMDAGVFVFVISLVISVVNGLLVGPVTTAFFGMYQDRKEGYPNLKTFFKHFIRFYWLSARVHLVFSIIISLLVFNVMMMVVEPGLLLSVAGIFSLYGLFFLMLLSFYFHPLIFYKNNFKGVFKKAFLLLIDNFGVTFGFGLSLLIMFLLCSALLFPVVLVFGAFYIYFIDNGFELIYGKYEALDEKTTREEVQ